MNMVHEDKAGVTSYISDCGLMQMRFEAVVDQTTGTKCKNFTKKAKRNNKMPILELKSLKYR